MMKKLFTISIAFLLSIPMIAQTTGTLNVSTLTSKTTTPVYAPSHNMAIWIEDASGKFVKTLLKYGNIRYVYLVTWRTSTTNAGSIFNTTDAKTAATYATHATRTCTWNGTDVNGNVVLDGTYRVRMELTDFNGQGSVASYTFTKGDAPVSLTPGNVTSFANTSIVWTPDVPPAEPVISGMTNTPTIPKDNQTAAVSAFITDDISVSSATLSWGLSAGSLSNTISMTANGKVYSATIPAQADGSVVYYEITAKDGDNHTTVSPKKSYLVLNNPPSNVALNKPITASGIEGAGTPAISANDGNVGSRWASNFVDNAWIKVDLGASYTINEFRLNWEAASAKNYYMLISDVDGVPNPTTWTVVALKENMAGGARKDILTDFTVTGRYVAMLGVSRNTPYGYSLYEFEAFGIPALVSGVEDESFADDLVFPNPSAALVNITPSTTSDIRITDLSGNVVYENTNVASNIQVNVQDFESGLYLVNVSSQKGSRTYKLMVD